MKKVLILSYFFPPCNLTAAQRSFAWAKFLPEKGIYPIIIANNWKQNNKQVVIEKHKGYEVHYLPIKTSLRDRLNQFEQNLITKSLSKILTLFTLILQSFFLYFNPFKNFYYYCNNLLNQEEGISSLIISANPFELFQVSYKLKQKHSRLKWIADYRDEWTTRELYKKNRGKLAFVRFCERYAEKKYTSNATLITTVCSYFLTRISNSTKKEGRIVENGYNSEILKNLDSLKQELPNKFSIVYSGTLYQNQPLQPFLDIYNEFLKDKTAKDLENIELLFLGSRGSISNKQLNAIEQFNFTNNIKILPRVDLPKANLILHKASFLIMFPYIGMEGTPTSKLYDNLIFKKKIILHPSDNNIIQDVLLNSGLGILQDKKNNLVIELNKGFAKYKNGEKMEVNVKGIEKYSRKETTFVLAEILKKHL